MPSNICPLIRPRYLQRSRRALTSIDDHIYINETDEPQARFEDMIIMDQSKAGNDPSESCSEKRELAEGLIKDKVVSKRQFNSHDE